MIQSVQYPTRRTNHVIVLQRSCSYVFGSNTFGDIYLPSDTIEDKHFDIRIIRAGKVWIQFHNGITILGGEACLTERRKESKSWDVMYVGGIKFSCVIVHREEEEEEEDDDDDNDDEEKGKEEEEEEEAAQVQPQTRFIIHRSRDATVMAEIPENSAVPEEEVLPENIYLVSIHRR
jgi:hypothetical protein